ncbi:MAG: hypothetical protein HZB65_01600 [Candidatus Aenigmarchaeota archaeon]|nr:hypothetical protein [Candidatus Aenigmarchaeota archaeon]
MKKSYLCRECGFIYKENKWADACEKWCKKNHTCNIDIIKHAIVKKE